MAGREINDKMPSLMTENTRQFKIPKKKEYSILILGLSIVQIQEIVRFSKSLKKNINIDYYDDMLVDEVKLNKSIKK